ncbi:MAG: N-formylglutamate deformylase [Sulfitobacter sp.]|nr:N-formylglutamate deformylase [Sulfitobacter sp.]
MTPVEVIQGDGPVVLGLPHTGTWLPDDVLARLNERGCSLTDTDWHIDQLYSGLLEGATTVRATYHRYLIDANRDPLGVSLYPGLNTTGLVPLTDFDGEPIWTDPPDDTEIEQRRAAYHAPYHDALTAELERVRAAHGLAILYDCHSIRSHIPFLFDGALPDFNIGTADGTSCSPVIEMAAHGLCRAEDGFRTVVNARFKGGWTTRHYGQTARGWHAIQMELAQSTYLRAEEPPWAYDPAKAERIRRPLRRILAKLAHLALNGDLT